MTWFVVFAFSAFGVWYWRHYTVQQRDLESSSSPQRMGERFIGQVVTVPKGTGAQMQTMIQRSDPLGAPLAAGQKVGTIQVTTATGTPVASLPLVVQEPVELAVEQIPDAVNSPLGQLRARLGELPRDREIHVICRSGGRAYYATRMLLQNGFKAQTIAGGMLSRVHASQLTN